MVTSEERKMFDEHSYSVRSAITCANETSSPETERLDNIICQFLREQNVPGATLAVAKNGCIIYEQDTPKYNKSVDLHCTQITNRKKGYGVAGAGRRMKSTTSLRVASISKPITAIAVLRLCQEGQLSLDDKVFGAKGLLHRLKPRGDKRLSKVTVRHLLQHSAGWDRDMAGDAVFWKVAPPSGVKVTSSQYNAHLLQYVLNRKLQFSPGSRHAYSNLGYLVLGEVIEAVTGQSYEHYVTALLSQIGVTGMKVGSEMRVHWQSEEGEYFNIKEPVTAASVMPGQDDSSVLPQYGSFLMRNTGSFGGWVGTAAEVLTIVCSLESMAVLKAVDSQTATGEKSTFQTPPSPGNTAPTRTLLTPDTVQRMLDRPRYESGRDWYGLGLDVQHRGATWGHTGAMEGTCGTVQRHRSGIAWAFLLNAWAANIDLDGVVKLALSATGQLSPFPCSVAMRCGEMLCVSTKDRSQHILVHVPHHRVQQEIKEKSVEGYGVRWIGVNMSCNKGDNGHSFNIIFFRNTGSGKGKKVLLDVEIFQLQSLLREYREQGFEPDFISTYAASEDTILALSVLSHVDKSHVVEVDVAVPAECYVQLLTQRRRGGFCVLSQCVTQRKSDLLVTAVMVKDCVSDPVFMKEGSVCVPPTSKCSKQTEDEHIQLNTAGSSQRSDIDMSRHIEFNRKWAESEDGKQTGNEVSKLMQTKDCEHTESKVIKQIENKIIEEVRNEGNNHNQHHWLKRKHKHIDYLSSLSVFHTGSPKHVFLSSYGSSSTKEEHGSLSENEAALQHISSIQEDHTETPDGQSPEQATTPSPAETKHSSSAITISSSPTKTKTSSPTKRMLSWVQMPVDSFVAELGRQARHRSGLRDVHFYPADGDWFVSGVWSPQITSSCYHQMGVSHLGLLPALAEAAAGDIKLRFLCSYEEEGLLYYALFWDAPQSD